MANKPTDIYESLTTINYKWHDTIDVGRKSVWEGWSIWGRAKKHDSLLPKEIFPNSNKYFWEKTSQISGLSAYLLLPLYLKKTPKTARGVLYWLFPCTTRTIASSSSCLFFFSIRDLFHVGQFGGTSWYPGSLVISKHTNRYFCALQNVYDYAGNTTLV